MNEPSQSPALRRTLGPFALIAYGVGDILGAGIYALIGEVARLAGGFIWVSFLVTVVVALLTAMSYAELGSRFPRSGSEAYFTQQAFRRPSLALMVGWLVLCSGTVSLATVSIAFTRYLLAAFQEAPSAIEYIVLVGFLLTLGGIAFWGIRQSSTFNIVCTFVETTGLLIVIVTGVVYLARGAETVAAVELPVGTLHMTAVLQGSALAFFAYIGFEDMVNLAEEAKAPRRNIPVALLVAIAVTGTLYVLVASVAAAVVPANELASARGPLIEVVHRAAPRFPIGIFSVIALFAVANTGLLNLVTGSRMLYGMSTQKLVPGWLSRVHSRTRTPHWAILAVLLAALLLAASGTLALLAGTSNMLILLVFVSINLSLLALKRRDARAGGVEPGEAPAWFRVPALIPVLGALTCVGLIVYLPRPSMGVAGTLIGLGMLLVILRARRPAGHER